MHSEGNVHGGEYTRGGIYAEGVTTWGELYMMQNTHGAGYT